MKRILVPILAIGVLLLSACGTQTTPPTETITITITPPPVTTTITPPPVTTTITPPPVTITITPPPITITPPTQIIENVTPEEAVALIQDNQNNPDFVILDVRTPEEFAEGYIEGAILIDFYSATFRDELDNLDKNKEYLIYCRSGNRSGQTLPIMEELGFQEVYNILGGIIEWTAEGLPLIE